MTEQIERELVELFSDRAERLDIRPPLPMAQHRRARLQSGLAVASVIAVIAGTGVVGTRLATQAAGRDVSVASSGDATKDLVQAIHRLQAGRWHVVLHIGAGSGVAQTVDVDWPAKTAIARADGQVQTIEVGGRVYHALPPNDPVTQSLPAAAKWQVSPGDSGALGSAGAPVIFGPLLPTDLGRSGVTVTRTATGFRVEADSTGENRTVTDVRVRRDGTIAAMHSVVTVEAPAGMPGLRGYVVDAVISPLSRPLHVVAPDPRTVVTSAQWKAAFDKMSNQSSHCTTTTPASTSPDGTRHPALQMCTHTDVLQLHQVTPTPTPTG